MKDELKKWEQYMRRWLANVYWYFFGQRDYKRFVIIGHERTGSSMLVSYLNAHPNIECHGEIFRFMHGQPVSKRFRLYFGYKPAKVKAAGFKMFYSHPKDGSHEALLDQVRAWPHPLIIHLTREDKLQMLASLRIAEMTTVWGLHVTREPPPLETRQVNLSPEELKAFIAHVRQEEQRIDSLFSKADYIHLTYEALTDRTEEILSLLFDRLHVVPHQVSTPHKKINTEPLDKRIINIDELKKEGLI